MHKGYLKIASLLGAVAVVLGAFGAHGLKQKLGVTDPAAIGVFQTGVQYHMYHTLALLAMGILYSPFPSALLRWAARSFIVGMLLFSGSLYAITAYKLYNVSVPRFLGPITPIGGLFFIAGWMLLFLTIAKGRK
ncbi:MAG: hypothetical protein RIR12_1092 [Bacteroidota bacterium]|jgi:uncharacterized membrane protein YgdD (TMEM256/DUF423 family)